MIHGIGVDIVEICRIERAWSKFALRFAEKILHETELLGLHNETLQTRRLAKIFAAKEAFVKALGCGFRNGLSFQQIMIYHDALGKPYFEVSGRAQEIMCDLNIATSHISIADERHYAVAMVVLEKIQLYR